MTKFAVYGRANCGYFARAQVLAEKLASENSEIDVDIQVFHPNAWQKALKKEKKKGKGKWNHDTSPIVYEELKEPVRYELIGGQKEFWELVKERYSRELTQDEQLEAHDRISVNKDTVGMNDDRERQRGAGCSLM
eukprot:m.133701 g.133701  ORF g.133701 m.133701 type:complete len:135 (+) comp14678_c1_seq2:106-510(+)